MNDFKTFLIPYDFSEGARAALFTGLDLARRLRALTVPESLSQGAVNAS